MFVYNIMDTNYIQDYNENVIDIYISNIEDKVLIDEYTFSYIINYILQRVYFNHLLIVFFMSCMSTIYICSYSDKRREYVTISNIEPLSVKGEVLDKV